MSDSTSSRERNMRGWVRQHGAEAIEHPGGNLYAHPSRVYDRLGRLGQRRHTAGRRLAVTGEVYNRFTNQKESLGPAQLRSFVDLSVT